MNRNVVRLATSCGAAQAAEALTRSPQWIAVETAPGEIHCVLAASDLMAYLEETEEKSVEDNIDLLSIPALRMDTVDIDFRATVLQAQDALSEVKAEALCVRRTSAPMIATVLGIITQRDIDSYRERPQ